MATSIKNPICGTNTSDTTATASDLLLDKISYGAVGKIIGIIFLNRPKL